MVSVLGREWRDIFGGVIFDWGLRVELVLWRFRGGVFLEESSKCKRFGMVVNLKYLGGKINSNNSNINILWLKKVNKG